MSLKSFRVPVFAFLAISLLNLFLASALSSQAALSTSSRSAFSDTPNMPVSGRISARGNELVDASGAHFFLAGVNYEGPTDRAWAMWNNDRFDPQLINQDLAKAAAGGYNSIRIFVQSALRDEILANNWSKLDKVVELAHQNGLRVLLTMADYYEPDLSKLASIDMSVARHFAGNDTILGYDLRNEPQFSDLISAIYPADKLPPMQTDSLLRVYGERLSQSASENWRHTAGRNQVPDYMNPRQAYIYTNLLRYYDEFQSDSGNWVSGHAQATALDYINSPDSAKWKPFLQALDTTAQNYIDVRQGAIQLADPNRLTTIGWNRPELMRLPANASLGFVSLHRFPGDSAGGLAETLSMLDHLKNFYSGKPVVMEEFGYSNWNGKDMVPPVQTAAYESSVWLFLYGRGYAGGFKWMLNNFTAGQNQYENNFGLLDNNSQPKAAYYSARAILQLISANKVPNGDFMRLESFDGVTISYSWSGSNSLFANNKDYRDSRFQVTTQEAAPWAIWWPNDGQGQLFFSTTSPAHVSLDLHGVFPAWKPGIRPFLNAEDGSGINFDLSNDTVISFNAQPGTIYTLRTPLKPPAFNRADPLQIAANTYFSETGHNLSNIFKQYWEKHGGLAIYGYPISEEFMENGFTVQYFERARFEHHPEFAGTEHEVELGLLGNVVTAGRKEAGEAAFRSIAPFNSSPTNVYFAETGHSLKGGFKQYWETHGGLAQFGYPITEEFAEVNPADGKTYTVQYFERNRFEWHPEHATTPSEFELGLLGMQVVKAKGWLS
ncbi:MAG TPA: cellulase family glycosylhydrolase [Chloroflexia bacterium]|nr:cellulase family glycosylhydrolase [Chloroflexia bacterium]